MKIKKIKKLFKNPKSFIADSRYFNFINSKKKVDNKLEIGFIVISQNHDLSRYSIDSIIQANNAASKSFPYIVIHDYDEKCGTETIHTIVKKLDTPYIKILFDGEKMPRRKKIIFLHLDGCSETPSISRTNTYTQTKAKNIYFIHQATHIPIHK